MGILGLARLIGDVCPDAIKEVEFKSYFGRRIAIDASMCLYQFLIAIRNNSAMMMNEEGEATSHLVGFFYRTTKLLENGIKPIYVFDGAAPELKSSELESRKEKRKEAEKKLEEATTAEDVSKYSKRIVKMTRQHIEESKKLLRLMGLPVIESPSEAEAQCAAICKIGLVYGVATEDMDGLTFGSERLIRNLSSGSAEKCKEFNLSKVLEGLGLTHNQFVDLCILMGCDYCDSIKGVGGKKGLDLIKNFGDIEGILRNKFNYIDFADVDVTYHERKKEEEINLKGDKDEIKNNEEEKEKSQIDEYSTKEDKVENGIKEEEANHSDVAEESIDEEKINGGGDSDEEEIKPRKKKKFQIEDDEDEKLEDHENESDDEKLNKTINKTCSLAEKANPRKKQKKDKEMVPKNWLFRGARKLFLEPNVNFDSITEADLKMRDPDEEGLIEFMCIQNGFSEDRIRSGIKRILAAKGKSSQTRIDSFFKLAPQSVPKKPETKKFDKSKSSKSAAAKKRKR